ncbi:lysine--tRNA ligase [Oenococcus kitaharae]|uniref:Lysine--tRNA ligase n=1 Tax=Oenococcus kitaharae DSM 17330 TaxID=1045004 RepID=G9WIY9_9LACO|nr:lysine--tRNA ligase [Oenococcus kitaharae]EHN58438.1 Lysyl-tRNA synthetase (class II) [Oenococcus kitaharae DSM 17330]MCV3296323.1 lysine--tRNA ligase [Oenococcus kitaharae]OEY81404.1 lysyl-tRNA synthetase [Oenococcus kitaharae]OEY82892.1 lysyl-tRNA synthetase [Oenococcus kitaharae]OEY84564.1 lysyl-tRNA synthetase [Oenococcus kitaharae]
MVEKADKELNDQLRVRLQKMQALKDDLGVDPFGHRFERDTYAKDIHNFADDKSGESLYEAKKHVIVAGRMMAKRGAGKVIFADIRDVSGTVQIYARRDDLGENYSLLRRADLGDILGFSGQVMKTDAGETTVLVDKITWLSKALRPLPDKFHGLTDIDTRYRKRYLDLIANPDSFDIFIKRSKIVKAIRDYMDSVGFIEVETPILQNSAGGAAARPFVTHHNALDIDMYLRIATELYLKRLIVGGMERVYEIGRIFRNEGMDTTHNPEFTTLESYAAYWDLSDVMIETENIIRAAAQAVNEDGLITYKDHQVDITKPFAKKSMTALIKEKTGIDFDQKMDLDDARQLADDNHVKYESFWGVGHIISEFFDTFVEKTLIEPTFVYHFPLEVSPLAKKEDDNPDFVQRFELYIAGNEYANAFTELNDPIDQRQRFEAQASERENGNDEAESIDEDYIEALEHGMAPTGGLGIGIDRLVMLLTDQASIRDVLLFPTMRN